MKLWIIRHAKSSWDQPGLSDFDRPLNKRGRRDGPVMQAWLKRQDCLPQWIISSDSNRTRETSEYVQAALNSSVPVIFSHQLYLPSLYNILDAIAETPSEITSLAVISHNPASTQIINWLAGKTVIDNLPTLGIARFNIDVTWNVISESCGRLDFISTPKLLSD